VRITIEAFVYRAPPHRDPVISYKKLRAQIFFLLGNEIRLVTHEQCI